MTPDAMNCRSQLSRKAGNSRSLIGPQTSPIDSLNAPAVGPAPGIASFIASEQEVPAGTALRATDWSVRAITP